MKKVTFQPTTSQVGYRRSAILRPSHSETKSPVSKATIHLPMALLLLDVRSLGGRLQISWATLAPARPKPNHSAAMTFLIEQGPLAVFAAFLVMHALADYPLQGDFLASQKARGQATNREVWIVALCAHCVIHAGGVWLVSGSLAYGAVEFVLHALIDLGKGEKKFGLMVDQLLHLACKVVYAIVLVYGQ